jgi:hypothetical protein
MKPILSYGFSAVAMLSLIFILKSLVGLEISMIVATVITYFVLNKLFPTHAIAK